MRVFVTGATGFVGPAIVRALLAEDHEVTALVHRDAGALASEPLGLQTVIGDVTLPATFEQAVRGHDAVVHLVGLRRAWPRRGLTFERLHIDATRNVLAAAEAGGARRFLHMSAHGVREDGTPYQRTKWAAEGLVRASSLQWTIFRPTFVTGPAEGAAGGMDHEFAAMARRAPALPNFGGGAFRIQPVAKRDLAEAFVRALTTPEAEGRTYALAGPDVLTWEEYLRALLDALGLRRPLVGVPRGLALPVAGALEGFGWFPASRDELAMLMEGHVADSGQAEKELGLTWTRFRDALREALATMPSGAPRRA